MFDKLRLPFLTTIPKMLLSRNPRKNRVMEKVLGKSWVARHAGDVTWNVRFTRSNKTVRCLLVSAKIILFSERSLFRIHTYPLILTRTSRIVSLCEERSQQTLTIDRRVSLILEAEFPLFSICFERSK